jgi:predicted metal-dependent phosphoesterase TrpH
MPPATIDLHTHSRYSDGLTTPGENAALAAAEGVTVLALTDHDTFDGWDAAGEACARHGVAFVPGVELSAEWEGHSVHVLGYWPDREDAALAAECERLRGERDRRAGVMVERLHAAGAEVSLARVHEIAGGAPIGRPHLAAAMVEAGVVEDFAAAFDDWIGDGGRAYEPKRALHPVQAVGLLLAAGAAAVLAHPGSGRLEGGIPVPLVDEMAAAGLTGIEADAAGHDLAVADRWRQLARARDLLVTGSSDFHGRHPDARIGSRTTAPEAFEALGDAATLRRTPTW